LTKADSWSCRIVAAPANRVFRIDRAVGLHIDYQTIEVGPLFDASSLDRVRHATYRAEGRIELQVTDGRSSPAALSRLAAGS
jgi:hypothetical protein